MPELSIDVASVKVMRSYDYCHFEVTLSSSTANTTSAVDELRKAADDVVYPEDDDTVF